MKRLPKAEAERDALCFLSAVASALPPLAPRDRFGRILGPRDCDELRRLAVKYEIGGCAFVDEQAGKVALAIWYSIYGEGAQ